MKNFLLAILLFLSSLSSHALDMLLSDGATGSTVIENINWWNYFDQLDYDDSYDTDDFATAMHFRGFIWGLLTYQDYYDIPYDTTVADLEGVILAYGLMNRDSLSQDPIDFIYEALDNNYDLLYVDESFEVDTYEAPAPKTSYESRITVTAKDLVNAYSENEIRAESNYSGKVIYVTGVIEDMARDIFDDYYIRLSGKAGNSWEDLLDITSYVDCYFSDSQLEDVMNLSTGDEVTIKGVCDDTDILGGVIMQGCSIAK